MYIKKTGYASFKGIRKVVRTISPEMSNLIKSVLKSNDSDVFLKQRKENPLVQIVSFYRGKKQVGILEKYKDGTFMGVRTFADGTSVTYSTRKVFTKLCGNIVIPSATVKGKGILSPFLPYLPYDKKGNIVIPTLKQIKEYNNPKNIINLIKTGKLKVIVTRGR